MKLNVKYWHYNVVLGNIYIIFHQTSTSGNKKKNGKRRVIKYIAL